MKKIKDVILELLFEEEVIEVEIEMDVDDELDYGMINKLFH